MHALAHHPFVAGALSFWMLLALVIQLDPSSVLAALVPTAVVILQHFLAKRQRSEIAREADAKIGEVHTLVNSQHEDLKRELDEVRVQNTKLQDRLAALPPPVISEGHA